MPHSVVLLNVVPSLGNLLASLMLISPVPAVLKLRDTGELGVSSSAVFPMGCLCMYVGTGPLVPSVTNPWGPLALVVTHRTSTRSHFR